MWIFFNRHENKIHPGCAINDANNEELVDAEPMDYLYNYHAGKLKFGLILLEFNDAIAEGDGDRLHNVYK